MLNLEFHKGQPCVYKSLLCQEGYCSECIICFEEFSQITPPISSGENKQVVFKRMISKNEPLQV